MILIVGKHEYLAEEVAMKFRDMHYGSEVLLRNGVRLLDFLSAHAQNTEMLIYVDKQQNGDSEPMSRLEHLQLLWSFSSKYCVPLMLVFFKYNAEYVVDEQLDRLASWTSKQFRQPPFHYIFKLGELYGTEGGDSVVDDYYRQISGSGVANVNRIVVGGETVERQLDYIHVKDVSRVLYWFVLHRPESGVYELGSGFPRTDSAVANAVFRTLRMSPQLKFSDQSSDLKSSIPQMTMDLSHLRHIGYKKPFYSVEKGVKTYIQKSLLDKKK